VADVAAKVDRKVAADASGFGSKRLGLSEHLAALLDDVLALPAHADDRSRGEELHKPREEGLFGKIGVVVLGHLLSRPNHLEANKLVSTFLETSDDVANEAPLDSVGLAGEEGPLLVGSGNSVNRKTATVGNGRGSKSGLCDLGQKKG
jgi:hypothetical protein